MNDCEKTNFKVFLERWNKEQNLSTPAIHSKMATWLQDCWETGKKRLLLMAFRASGKSTLIGLFSAWVLYRDPACRILVLAAESSLAKKMVRNIKRVIEKHPLTTHLKPDNADQWAADRFTVNRDKELRDPSVLARGITANITGCRADLVICDDVEVPNTSDSAEKRRALRERLSEINFVLTPEGSQLYTGTPHTWNTIYAKEPREEIGEEQAFLEGFHRKEIPLLNEKGESAWPEFYTLEDIEQMKLQSGPNKFASQMMLQPVNIADGRLDPTLMRPYEGTLEYSEANGQMRLHLDGQQLVSCSAWWDPAFCSADGDRSVIAIVYTDADGQYYLQHLEYLKPEEVEGDEASWQCGKVAQLAEDFYLPSIAVETNGIGKFLPEMLRQELGRRNMNVAVLEKSSRQAKAVRILEGFDAVLAARALSVHKSVYKTPFIIEMQEWRPEGGKTHDDGLDAVAGALSQEPVRLKRIYPSKGGASWRPGSNAFQARTEFKT